MAAICPHGFSLPKTRYGDVLLPPNECHDCRSNTSFDTAIRLEGSVPNMTNQAFDQESWDSGQNLFPQNNNNLWNMHTGHELDGFRPTMLDSLRAQGTYLSESQDLPQQPKSARPSHFKVLFLDGNKTRHVAKRRGPLTEGGRDNIKRLRAKAGACWRCKVLKKQVGLFKVFDKAANCISVMARLPVKNAQLGSHENGILNAQGETSKTVLRIRSPVSSLLIINCCRA